MVTSIGGVHLFLAGQGTALLNSARMGMFCLFVCLFVPLPMD